MIWKSVSIAVIAALMTSDAAAAVLTNVQGPTEVNHGYGYGPAVSGSGVLPGDRVRAGEGSAEIAYENGCTQKVAPGETAVVLSAPPACEDAATVPYLAGGVLVGGGIAATAALDRSPAAGPADPDPPSQPASP